MKIVDAEARRLELANAVWQVVEQSGIRAASVRAVAKQAGVSPGSLRHYFSDQAGLLRFAAERMTDQVTRRMLAHLEETAPPRETALAVLMEFLPADARRRVECAVWLECLLQSRHDPQLAAMKDVGVVGARHVCRTAWALHIGVPRPARGAELPEPHETLARQLHYFIEGLTLHATVGTQEFAEEDLRTEVQAELESLARAVDPLTGSRRPASGA